MWGDSIARFWTYHDRSKSGREGDWFLTGFSPRKQNFSRYIKRLADVGMGVLRTLISQSVKEKRSSKA